MEELTIWEQHTITLSKVSVGQERISQFGSTPSVWSGGWRGCPWAKIRRRLRSPLGYPNETARAWIAEPRLQQEFTAPHPSVCTVPAQRECAPSASISAPGVLSHLSPSHSGARPHFSPVMFYSQDPKFGFGFALSGGKDKPNPDNGDTTVVVSDVLPNGPAMGRLL